MLTSANTNGLAFRKTKTGFSELCGRQRLLDLPSLKYRPVPQTGASGADEPFIQLMLSVICLCRKKLHIFNDMSESAGFFSMNLGFQVIRWRAMESVFIQTHSRDSSDDPKAHFWTQTGKPPSHTLASSSEWRTSATGTEKQLHLNYKRGNASILTWDYTHPNKDNSNHWFVEQNFIFLPFFCAKKLHLWCKVSLQSSSYSISTSFQWFQSFYRTPSLCVKLFQVSTLTGPGGLSRFIQV